MADSRMLDVLGLVPAGGRAVRFGRDKAVEPIGGVPMAEIVYRTLASVIRDVRIGLADAGQRNPIPHSEVVLDDPPASGPIGSLRAGLLAAGDRWLFIAACDMPGLDVASVRRLLDARRTGVDVVVARDPAGRPHPLAAVWHPGVLPRIDAALAEGRRSLVPLANAATAVSVPLPHGVLQNVNRPGDADLPPPA